MQEKELKLLFDAGDLQKAYLIPAIMEEGWMLSVKRKGRETLENLETKRGERRVFKTVDAAWRTTREIGFSAATITIHGA